MPPEESWLLALADPDGTHNSLPGIRLELSQVARLCELAHAHGVLPAVLEQLDHLVKEQPGRLLASGDFANDLDSILKVARECHNKRAAMCLFFVAETRRLMRELSAGGVQVIALKGADFAARLYSRPALRLFGDIDLLIRREDRRHSDSAMKQLGYQALPGRMNTPRGMPKFNISIPTCRARRWKSMTIL